MIYKTSVMNAPGFVSRSHVGDGWTAEAVYSHCEQYRYILARQWDEEKPLLGYLMLNPSTATERQLDATVERCYRRAMALGYGGFVVVNLFPLRSTDPNGMLLHENRLGNEDAADAAILDAAQRCERLVCAWGNHRAIGKRSDKVMRDLALLDLDRKLVALGINKDGSPKHPLYLPYSAELVPFPRVEAVA